MGAGRRWCDAKGADGARRDKKGPTEEEDWYQQRDYDSEEDLYQQRHYDSEEDLYQRRLSEDESFYVDGRRRWYGVDESGPVILT